MEGLNASRIKRNLKRALGRFVQIVGLLAFTIPTVITAKAQDGSEAGARSSEVLEEVLVYARRKAEKLEDVPVAVSAFDEAALEERRIVSEVDLMIATPGLLSKQGMSSNYINYSLRGQSVGSFSYSPPAVVTYFNDVAVGGLSATSFFDLQSIQVLKGPQGTLFGRNTTGGAALYRANAPEREFTWSVKGAVGNFDNREFEAIFNFPVGDSWALRLSGRLHERDGFQKNLIYGTDANSVDAAVVRAGILFAPADSGFENILTIQDGDYGGKNGAQTFSNAYGSYGSPTTYIDPNTGLVTPLDVTMATVHAANAAGPGISSTNPLVNALFNGVEDYFTKRNSGQYGDFWDFYGNLHEGEYDHEADHQIVTNATTFELSDGLTIKNILGYNSLMSSDKLDIDGGPYEWIAIDGGPSPRVNGKNYPAGGYVFGLENWSNELQILGEAGNLSYIAGVYYSDETTYAYSPISIAPDLPDLGFNGYLGAYYAEIADESLAVYGQVTWEATDKLSLSAGLRYTWEDVEISFRDSKPGETYLLSGMLPTREKWDDPSWLLSATYDLSDDLMIYVTQRGSWRTGGFNATSAANYPYGDSFEPETTYDIEVGAKLTGYVGSVPARMTVAVYNQWVEDVQRTIYIVTAAGPAAVAGNVEEAEVTGVEIEAVFDLTEWFQIGGTFAHTDARYTNPQAIFGGQEFTFGPYSDTPENSGSLYFKVQKSTVGLGDLALRAEIYAQDAWHYSNTGDTTAPLTEIDGYEIVNVRAEWNNMFGSNVGAALFGRNLTEEEFYVGGNSNASTGGFNAIIPGEPRMWGLEMYYRF